MIYLIFYPTVNFAESVYLVIEGWSGLKPCKNCGRTFEPRWR